MEEQIKKEEFSEQDKTLVSIVKRLRTDIVQRLEPAEAPRTDIVQRLNHVEVPRAEAVELDCPVEGIPDSKNWLMPVEYRACTAMDLVNGYRTVIAKPDVNWITDFLWEERWAPGETVLVDAVCSAGKNTYIEALAATGRYDKILILANRRANREQIKKRMGSLTEGPFRRVDVITYQSLENNPKLTTEKLEDYDLIVLDECHYFTKDSVFSSRVNVSFRKVMETKTTIKMFMSATMADVRKLVVTYLRRKYSAQDLPQLCTNYVLRKQKQNIRSVNCIDDIALLARIKVSSEKWMIFVDSKEFGNKLKGKIGDEAIFINADNVSNGKMEEQEFWNLVNQEQFEHRVLIATAVLDNGVNVKDKKLKNVVLSCNDKTQMVQMLGRKRCVDEEDFFDLYLLYEDADEVEQRLVSNRQLQEKWKSLEVHLQKYGWPPLIYSINCDEGEKMREIFWMDPFNKCFHFNHLGVWGLRIIETDLLELRNAQDIFETKVSWLFEGLPTPTIDTRTEDVITLKILRIVHAVEKYIGGTYAVKSTDFDTFRKLFSDTFWASFGVDTEGKQRADRTLSVAKINFACEKFNIPLRIIRAEDDKDRKTQYSIVATKPLEKS